MTAKLNVNIDHVATIREARKTIEPSVIEAARICEQAGAHGITVHIRGDRRHIQDADIQQLREIVTSYLNVEMAATDEMIEIAVRTKPNAVSLVPESPNEITTEGGLDVIANFNNVKNTVEKLKAADIFVSIFIDPDLEQISAASNAGAQQVELCTAEYAELTLQSSPPYAVGGVPDNTGKSFVPERGVAAPVFEGADGVVFSPAEHTSTETKNHPPAPAVPLLRKEGSPEPIAAELSRIAGAAVHAHSLGLKVAAGHGLTYRNVAALARIPEITEFNIGHNIISRSVFVGLNQAVKEMIEAIQ